MLASVATPASRSGWQGGAPAGERIASDRSDDSRRYGRAHLDRGRANRCCPVANRSSTVSSCSQRDVEVEVRLRRRRRSQREASGRIRSGLSSSATGGSPEHLVPTSVSAMRLGASVAPGGSKSTRSAIPSFSSRTPRPPSSCGVPRVLRADASPLFAVACVAPATPRRLADGRSRPGRLLPGGRQARTSWTVGAGRRFAPVSVLRGINC